MDKNGLRAYAELAVRIGPHDSAAVEAYGGVRDNLALLVEHASHDAALYGRSGACEQNGDPERCKAKHESESTLYYERGGSWDVTGVLL